MNRETWLNSIADKMRPRFDELGYPLPKFRVAIGFTSAGKSSEIGGECWNIGNSADGHFEIFISPILDDPMRVAGVLAHELIHAAVGFEQGHKGNFAKVALEIGLLRPMTATTEGPIFIEYAQPLIDSLGPLPHAKLSWSAVRSSGTDQGCNDNETPAGGSSNSKPKQKTRMLKACCDRDGCGYTIRLSKKWADKLGATCPVHGSIPMDDSDEVEAA